MATPEELYNGAVKQATAGIKKYVYDLISLVIIAFVIIASLQIFDVVDYSNVPPEQVGKEAGNFFAEWLPYFMAMVMLNANLYNKGAFVGKATKGYIDTITAYSGIVGGYDGKRISALTPFCEAYNDKALQSVRQSILHAEGLTYEQFSAEWSDRNGTKQKPLRFMSGKEQKAIGLTFRQRWAVLKAKLSKVHGINVNILLSSHARKDPTNIGATEKQMSAENNVSNTARYLVSTFLMSLITIKDIAQWGWAGIIVVLFKLAFVVARCFMSYFTGYNNITVNLASHITRKIDILKEYDAWYEDNTQKVNN